MNECSVVSELASRQRGDDDPLDEETSDKVKISSSFRRIGPAARPFTGSLRRRSLARMDGRTDVGTGCLAGCRSPFARFVGLAR